MGSAGTVLSDQVARDTIRTELDAAIARVPELGQFIPGPEVRAS